MKKMILFFVCALAIQGYAADTLANEHPFSQADTSLNTNGEADYFAPRREKAKQEQLEIHQADSIHNAIRPRYLSRDTIEACAFVMSGYQLYQIVNGYMLFKDNGGYRAGIAFLPTPPIAFEIKNPKSKKTKEYLSQLHPGMHLCQMLDEGTVIYKTGTVQMETVTGFTEEIKVFAILINATRQ